MRVRQLRRLFAFLLITFLFLLTACSEKAKKEEKLKDMDFTVVPEAEIPENLKTIIDSRKEHGFTLTYATEDALYLVVGYGEQSSSGYSIQVPCFYQTTSYLVLDTELIGPSKQDQVSQTPTYPYLVIKTEFIDLPVEFE